MIDVSRRPFHTRQTKHGNTDLSSGVVLGLIVIVVVVSLVSFLVYQELLGRFEEQPQRSTLLSNVLVNGGKATGEVGITIAAPPEEVHEVSEEVEPSTTPTT